MIDTTEIHRLKRDVSIADLLASRDILPVSQHQHELKYHSPLREDKFPSFYVNTRDNVFSDVVVADHRGDVIRLLQLLDGISFAVAVQVLQQFEPSPSTPSFFLSGISLSTTPIKDKIRAVKPLNNPSLLHYTESRGVHVSTARRYLHEVHYTHGHRHLYAVGFANDRGGYVLRNGVGCKRNIGAADLTTVEGWRAECVDAECNIFEGVFDFLSCLDFYGVTIPKAPTYVLNSVSHLSKLILKLSPDTKINAYFDNDTAGIQCIQRLRRHFATVIDGSTLYQDHNDFNEFFIAQLKSGYIRLKDPPIQ